MQQPSAGVVVISIVPTQRATCRRVAKWAPQKRKSLRPLRIAGAPCPTERKDLTKTSYFRKLVSYAATYRHDLHTKRYNLPDVRVLTVTPGRQRIANIIAAHREHAASLVSSQLFLFADRAGLTRAEDVLDYPFVDAAGEQHRLLDETNLFSATSHRPWRTRRPSASLAHRRSGGQF